ncbi:MAG TPA: uroporphyrinogen decarboxylase, partial [Thermoanaerobaculia bacterium]
MTDPGTSSAQRLLDACFGRPVDRPPVWMMRQAGRYLPEYRDVRKGVSFWELCRSTELAAEVSLQPFRRFHPDGVIFFSDILVPVAPMGVTVEFSDGGPHLPEPVRASTDVDRLHAFDPSREIGFTGQILGNLRAVVGDRAAVLGFAGAPWTLASYLVEGGGSKSFAAIKEMMGRDPRTLERLTSLLADVVGDVLSFQIESGAQAVQLFDTWAGELAVEDYRRFALPAVQRAIAGIRRNGAPVILYVNGCGHLLEAMAESGADVLSIDWRVPIAE